MYFAVPLAFVLTGILSAEGALGAQDDSVFFAGFEGTWTVTAIVSGGADAREERSLRATVEGSDMDPVRIYQIVLTGSLPEAFLKTCPETFGVPLPCETSFRLACYCDREEEWFQDDFVRIWGSRPAKDPISQLQLSGKPDSTGRRVVMQRGVGRRISAYYIWTKQEDGYVLRYGRFPMTGEWRESVKLTFEDRAP